MGNSTFFRYIYNTQLSFPQSLAVTYPCFSPILNSLLQMTPNGIVPLAEFDTKDGVYDCSWSEVRLHIHNSARRT